MRSRPERLSETPEQMYDRLSRKDRARKERLQASIREHHYAQFDFRPRVNSVSARIVQETHKHGKEQVDKGASG